jgi:hypothetical protein
MLLVEEQGDSEVANLLLRVFGGRDQVDGFKMPKVDIVALDIYVQQFTDVFFLLVSVKLLALELLSYVCKFLVDPLFLEFSRSRIPQVRNELDKTTHGRHDQPGCNGFAAAVGSPPTIGLSD